MGGLNHGDDPRQFLINVPMARGKDVRQGPPQFVELLLVRQQIDTTGVALEDRIDSRCRTKVTQPQLQQSGGLVIQLGRVLALQDARADLDAVVRDSSLTQCIRFGDRNRGLPSERDCRSGCPVVGGLRQSRHNPNGRLSNKAVWAGKVSGKLLGLLIHDVDRSPQQRFQHGPHHPWLSIVEKPDDDIRLVPASGDAPIDHAARVRTSASRDSEIATISSRVRPWNFSVRISMARTR